MSKFILALILLSTSVTFAATEVGSVYKIKTTNSKANINEGNYIVGGSAALSYTSSSGASVNLNPTFKYFIAPQLAVGGELSFFTSSTGSTVGLGPAATYYFWQRDQLASYVGGSLLYYSYNSNSEPSTALAMLSFNTGLSYFITPSVAVGPEFNMGFTIGRADTPSFSLLGAFSILL